MPKINPDIETTVRIKVVGVGGSGKNALNHMIESGVEGVEFICMNTDTQDLHNSLAPKKIHIGRNLTKGQGTGMNPETGREAAEETKAEIQEALKGADMVFIACGMGGGTGTGAAPTIAAIAREQGALTVGVVTKPFSFEGQQRTRIAESGLASLEKNVDALIVVPNDLLLTVTSKDTTFKDAFAMSDEILRQAVEGISELITTQGKINIDFADIRSVMQDAGAAFMGIGIGIGENRAEEAAYAAINTPLLDVAITGAKGVLFAISGSEDLTMHEIDQIAKIVTDSVDPDAKIFFSPIFDERLKKGEIRVTVIATGFVAQPKKQSSPTRSGSFFSQKSTPKEEPQKEKEPERELEDYTPEIKKPIIEKQIEEIDDEDDDWSSVPAFLRRKK